MYSSADVAAMLDEPDDLDARIERHARSQRHLAARTQPS
jgi:hypothetical protein